MQGYFKSVNPEEFKEILMVSSQGYKDSVVLFATGMGQKDMLDYLLTDMV